MFSFFSTVNLFSAVIPPISIGSSGNSQPCFPSAVIAKFKISSVAPASEAFILNAIFAISDKVLISEDIFTVATVKSEYSVNETWSLALGNILPLYA